MARRYLAPGFGSGALFLGSLLGLFLAGDGGFMFLVLMMGFFGLCPFGGVGYGLGVLHFGSPGRWLARRYRNGMLSFQHGGDADVRLGPASPWKDKQENCCGQ